jgi:hypothetical protein
MQTSLHMGQTSANIAAITVAGAPAATSAQNATATAATATATTPGSAHLADRATATRPTQAAQTVAQPHAEAASTAPAAGTGQSSSIARVLQLLECCAQAEPSAFQAIVDLLDLLLVSALQRLQRDFACKPWVQARAVLSSRGTTRRHSSKGHSCVPA